MRPRVALIFLHFRAGASGVTTGALPSPLSMARDLVSILYFCDSKPSIAASITSFDSFVGI
jgi:hypothetical protein